MASSVSEGSKSTLAPSCDDGKSALAPPSCDGRKSALAPSCDGSISSETSSESSGNREAPPIAQQEGKGS
eukprot:2414904-Pyramimonas_sp.AAC.1